MTTQDHSTDAIPTALTISLRVDVTEVTSPRVLSSLQLTDIVTKPFCPDTWPGLRLRGQCQVSEPETWQWSADQSGYIGLDGAGANFGYNHGTDNRQSFPELYLTVHTLHSLKVLGPENHIVVVF